MSKRLLACLALLGLCSCIPMKFTTDGKVTVMIAHSSLDEQGGCEKAIGLHIDMDPGADYLTRAYPVTCVPFEVEETFTVGYGLTKAKTWAFDLARNYARKSRPLGWFYRMGYDSSFTVRKSGDWLICHREWPNTFQGNQAIQMAWTTDGVLGEWQTMCEDSLNVNICPKNTVHLRMCYSTDIWSIAEGEVVHREYATWKRVVQIEPLWVGELE